MHKNQHKGMIRSCFNRAVHTYDMHSYPQQMIGMKLLERLDAYLHESPAIIDIGCGTGLVTEYLAKHLNYKLFYAIDLADELLLQAQARLSQYDVKLNASDFDEFLFENRYFSLAFSNMSLQWSPDLNFTLQHIKRNLSSHGLIAFTLPIKGTFNELNPSSRNTFFTLNDIEECLISNGYRMLHTSSEGLSFAFSSWRKALVSIKATGANYLFNKQKKTLLNKIVIDSSKPALTYQVGYFIARKKCKQLKYL